MSSTIFKLEQIDQVSLDFAQRHSEFAVFCFEGEMGAGKTTFIKALCKHWHVSDTVASPTYSVINKYACFDGSSIYHLDLFRIKSTDELIDIGFEDILLEPYPILIEWPQFAYPLLFASDFLQVTLDKISENTRKIIIFT